MPTASQIAALQRAVDRVPRVSLAHLPTPLEELPRLSRTLGGPRIHVKRDDCTGLACGGNKARHNEYLLADALDSGADMFVWGAGVQSNNCRQTAASCAKVGLDCHLVLGRGRALRPGEPPEAVQGNLLLDHLLGASYEIVEEAIGDDLDRRIVAVADRFRTAGRKPYLWDRDRVTPLAAISYVTCLAEIVEQSAAAGFVPDAIYVCSAGSTGSGAALGAKALGLATAIKSICPIQWPWDTQQSMADIANVAAARMELDVRLTRDDVDVTFDYIGPGYSKASPGCLEAIALVARTEGVLLDPIYTGKAAAALIDHVRDGRYAPEKNVVLIHTGGTPALFAHSEELAAGIAPRRL